MKKVLLITALVVGLASAAFAGPADGPRAREGIYNGPPHPPSPPPRHMRNVTPYGDFCPNCSVYGVRYKHKQVRHDKAVEAIRAYFVKRGFQIGNVRGLGRFIKVDIYKDEKLVDRIVFDRKTGRIRSIY